MYSITKLLNGEWLVECRIQDGTECWREKSRQEAIHSLIRSARVMNGSHIHEGDITFEEEDPPKARETTAADAKLLDEIRTKRKIVLDHTDKRLQYRITDKECDLIIAIREGRLDVVERID